MPCLDTHSKEERGPSRARRSWALLACPLGVVVAGTALAAPAGTPLVQPSDPGYLDAPGSLRQIDAPAFWAVTRPKGCSATWAVLDSGVAAIADLPALRIGRDLGRGTGDNAHGTEVASIGSAAQNAVGTAGLTSCPVLSVRVTDPDGGSTCDDLAAATDYASTQAGVRVINISFSQAAGDSVCWSFVRTVRRAVARGVLVVLSAGNGSNNDLVGSANPSTNPLAAVFHNDPGVIRTAGVDADWTLDPGSNHGAQLADIAAPFHAVVDEPDGSYRQLQGTSFAAAMVSAVAAQLFSWAPRLTPAQVKRILMTSGLRVPGLDVGCGCVLNAYNALLDPAIGYEAALPVQRSAFLEPDADADPDRERAARPRLSIWAVLQGYVREAIPVRAALAR